MLDEQAENQELETTQEQEVVDQPSSGDEISDIFGKALKDEAGSPEDSGQTEEGQAKEQLDKDEKIIETPYGEITLDEAKKIAFKSEKEFQDFLEKNPFLKEKAMLKSDYTRKTTQVAEERKRFQEELGKFQEEKAKNETAWGTVKPTTDDMGFFHGLWHVHQNGSDQPADQISAFAKDISLLSRGQKPVGPLASSNGQAVDFSRDSQVIGVKREFDKYRQEQQQKEEAQKAEAFERQKSEAIREVNTWLSEKKEQGIEITVDERQAMADLSGLKDREGNRLPLDELHRLALARLGKTEKLAIKKVFTDSKDHSKRTPQRPNSRVPSNAKPDASDLDGIFNQGLEEIRS